MFPSLLNGQIRFSYRNHRFLKQITELEARRIKFIKIGIRVRPELEQHVVVTGNTTQLKWPGRTFLRVCIVNGEVSEKNLFIDGVSHKRNIMCGFVFSTLFTNRFLC